MTLASLIVTLLSQFFLTNHQGLKTQVALTTLETRTRRITSILREDMHRADGKVSVISDSELLVGGHHYFIENHNLVVIDANHRKSRLVREVDHMKVRKQGAGIDVSIWVGSGSLGATIHVFVALK